MNWKLSLLLVLFAIGAVLPAQEQKSDPPQQEAPAAPQSASEKGSTATPRQSRREKQQQQLEEAAQRQRQREQEQQQEFLQQQAKDRQAKDQQAKDQQAKDQQAKEQRAKDQRAKDQRAKDQQIKAQQAKEQRAEQQDDDSQLANADEMAADSTYGSGSEAWEDEPGESSPQAVASASAATPIEWALLRQWLPVVNLGLVALLIIALLASKAGLRKVLNNLQREIATLKGKVDHTENTLGQQNELVKRLQTQFAEVGTLNQNVSQLANQMTEIKREGSSSHNRGGGDYISETRINVAREEQPPARGPMSVTDYLERAGREGRLVRLELDRFNDSVFTPDDAGFYFLVRGRDGSDYAIPVHEKFQTKQLFDTYYNPAYECRVPGSGDVWVVRPALVRQDGDFWRLDERGEIEVRAS
ncbi:MAG TPA: hypothetical protein VF432_10160 [Thermoanaerobaculia bacterium]